VSLVGEVGNVPGRSQRMNYVDVKTKEWRTSGNLLTRTFGR
jgi:hypothetical protein